MDIEFEESEVEEVPDYPVNLFFTKEGYFKKITPLSLRMGGEHKLKDNDKIIVSHEGSNRNDLLFFTNQQQVYKAKASDFADTKASTLGDFVATKLEMSDGEVPIQMIVTTDYSGYLLFFFENGKAAKIPLSSYETKTNRKKLVKAYSDDSPVVAIIHITEDSDFVLVSTAGRHLLVNTGAISVKTTKHSIGVSVMTLKKGHRVMSVKPYVQGQFAKPYRYKTKNLPATGALLSAEDAGEQMLLE